MQRSPANINPFTDFGFKKLFGEEASKELLLDFLNAVLQEEVGLITSIEFSKNEHLGLHELDRKAVFDIYCITESGERIIVEIQKAFQAFFKERTLYYGTFALQEQAIRGEWNFDLKAVFCISLLDFVMDSSESKSAKFLHKVKLIEEESGKVFNDKLCFVYLEIPKFKKKLHELETKFEKWVYLLQHLEFLDRLPERLQEKIFDKVMDIATLVKLDKKERQAYEDSLKNYRDLKNVLDSNFDRGVQKGIEKGIVSTALNLKALGIPIEIISQATKLSIAQLEQIFKDEGL